MEKNGIKCLNEADMYAMPRMMQNLFATILINCKVLDPNDLWDRHCDQLIRYQAPFWPMTYSRNDACYEAYINIEQIMQKN
jgi:hypothetical protein